MPEGAGVGSGDGVNTNQGAGGIRGLGRTVAMVAACILALLGSPANAAGAQQRPLAVATISILADFVRAVAGDRLEVVSIVHVGGDPHTYEPVPSDARRIADADVVVRNGLGLERWLDRLIATGAKARVITATEGLDPVLQADGEYRGHPDPHLWMDPRLAAAYVRNIEAALSRALPAACGGVRRARPQLRRAARSARSRDRRRARRHRAGSGASW